MSKKLPLLKVTNFDPHSAGHEEEEKMALLDVGTLPYYLISNCLYVCECAYTSRTCM